IMIMTKPRTSCAPARRAFFRPMLENLEDRTLLSSVSSPSEFLSLLGLRMATTRPAAGSAETKLESTYRAALQAVEQHSGAQWSATLARDHPDGAIQTYIHLADWQAGVNEIQRLGIAVEAADEAMRVVQAWVMPAQVEELAGLASVAALG